jgi:dipeptidyl aminopeptidase/acylaminoacyl peptidase
MQVRAGAVFVLVTMVTTLALPSQAEDKRLINIDEFMNATDLQGAKLSADGSAAVFVATDPDWNHNRFASDLWMWQEKTGNTVQLTHSGHAREPQWSPDGKYIAFLSDSPLPDEDKEAGKDATERVWVIASGGGDSFPLYGEKLEAHAFAWSADSSRIFFSCTSPLSKNAEESNKTKWNDVIRWREQERGDLLVAVPVRAGAPSAPPSLADDAVPLPPSAARITSVSDAITEIVVSPAGTEIAFVTDSVSRRLEEPGHIEIYRVNSGGGEAERLTRNQAHESDLAWSSDGKHIYFNVKADEGAVESYRSIQGRLYALEVASKNLTRLGSDFSGSFEGFALMGDGKLLAAGLKGTQQQLYVVEGDHAVASPGLPGSYSSVAASPHSHRLLVIHSTLTQSKQVYVAEDAAHMKDAKAISAVNRVFAERARPEWKPYQWTADDGTRVEGVLIYPPGRMGEKKLRMLTLIHGGPADADGDRFGADWYDWATLAAARGWLVFRPNYRGSSGYGDTFMLEIAPHLVSRPGKDILEGVDALVKDGIADPDRLTIGGYSYGGYMTNWLITQTTEFKAAVTGAGAVEHAANWGNDDTGYDDTWYMGGSLPWQNPSIYQSEAALFQMDKVKTPTHIVGGDADVRVSFLEDVLLERALQQLKVPHTLLVFPGEGHPLDKNPWHGYIKVREELDWLDRYGGAK